MGCTSSKKSRFSHCRSPNISAPRNCSKQFHHPAQRKGESYHVVALKSSTLGSLKLIDDDEKEDNGDQKITEAMNMEAKDWSNMINEKIPNCIIPKTPTSILRRESEIINSWELMEGIQDDSPDYIPSIVDRSFSFHVIPDSTTPFDQSPKSKLPQENQIESEKPYWFQITENDSNPKSEFKSIAFDWTFRKSMEELPPTNPFHLRSSEIEGSRCPPRGEDKVVVYFTSLRGIRKTYEACCHVRAILKEYGVRVDERDVSMHYRFREELKGLLALGGDDGLVLPRVFVKGRCIGGAEEVRQLHEGGKMGKVLEGCDQVVVVEEGGGGVCEACGDFRFVLCETCSGSCKIYYGDDQCGFHRCTNCNENGILRCPICCY